MNVCIHNCLHFFWDDVSLALPWRRRYPTRSYELHGQRLGADMTASLEDAVHLLQKAAMLETGADVLALTSEELR